MRLRRSEVIHNYSVNKQLTKKDKEIHLYNCTRGLHVVVILNDSERNFIKRRHIFLDGVINSI